jgi:hypothetical protein
MTHLMHAIKIRLSTILLAKNLDWPISDGYILVNKPGVKKNAFTNQHPRISWISKYGSITLNQFGKEFPLGGMNEAGLAIEELNSWGMVHHLSSWIRWFSLIPNGVLFMISPGCRFFSKQPQIRNCSKLTLLQSIFPKIIWLSIWISMSL